MKGWRKGKRESEIKHLEHTEVVATREKARQARERRNMREGGGKRDRIIVHFFPLFFFFFFLVPSPSSPCFFCV